MARKKPKNNLLETFVAEAAAKGLTYGQLQQQETAQILKQKEKKRKK